MEAGFQPENFWIFSGAFRSLSCAFPPEIGRKSSEIFLAEYCFYVPMISSVFLQDPAFFRLFPAGSFGIWSPESSTWGIDQNGN